jgi:hypothetical protein
MDVREALAVLVGGSTRRVHVTGRAADDGSAIT